MAAVQEVHRTDRRDVSYIEEENEYAIEFPTDFEDVYKVNAAHVYFYQPGEDEPLDSFEMNFAEKRIDEMDGLTLPDDRYAGREFEVVFLYHPAFGVPYERVREEMTDLQPAEELDGRVTTTSTLVNADELNRIDYLRIDIRDPETGDYVAGDIVPIEETSEEDDETLLASGTVQIFPNEFAGFEAEIAYLAAE